MSSPLSSDHLNVASSQPGKPDEETLPLNPSLASLEHIYSSFLNIDRIYEVQERLVNDQREGVRSLDGPSQSTRTPEAASSTPPHLAAVGVATFPVQEQLPTPH
ncbi:predicted protein [Histoplasma capsulatum H143]|uniref:Uncharacterized protein n=1 Tax=Ajellomyces capsulatus (strain H143) TaxID=544712 RepID=C6HN63_AJECH|nr:predicted protein [Histoplasma capsulatum H143]